MTREMVKTELFLVENPLSYFMRSTYLGRDRFRKETAVIGETPWALANLHPTGM